MTAARRKGRSLKSDDGSATKILTMRLRSADYEEIRKAAEASGRSISAQAEVRLLQPEQAQVGEIAQVVDLVVRAVEARAKASWRDGSHVQIRIWAAVTAVLRELLGEPIDEATATDEVLRDMRKVREADATGLGSLALMFSGISRDEVNERLAVLRDLLEDQEIAKKIVSASGVVQ